MIMSDSVFRSLLLHFLIPTLAVAILALAGGCSSSEEGPTGPDAPTETLQHEAVEQSSVNLETIDQGAYGNTEEASLLAIRDQDTFESFWNSLHGGNVEVPDVDFSEKMVLATVLGERPTGGYEAEITGVTRGSDPPEVSVSLTETEPGPNCIVTQAITVPYHIVKVDQVSPDRLVFGEREKETRACN